MSPLNHAIHLRPKGQGILAWLRKRLTAFTDFKNRAFGGDEGEDRFLGEKEGSIMAGNDIPPCLIYIDKQGRWFHKGVEMIHREFIRLFYQHMEIDSQGRYVINWGGDRCYVEVEDVPFVVRRTTFKQGNQDNSRFILLLSDDCEEDLTAETLFIGDSNVLYCKVKNRTFPARFDRPAYYQLAEYIKEENGRYFLPLNGENHRIQEKGSPF